MSSEGSNHKPLSLVVLKRAPALNPNPEMLMLNAQRAFSGKDARIQQQCSSECKQIAELGACKSTSVMMRFIPNSIKFIITIVAISIAIIVILLLLIFLLLLLSVLFLLLLLLGFARGAVSGHASSMIPALQAYGSFLFAAPRNVMRGIRRSNPC